MKTTRNRFIVHRLFNTVHILRGNFDIPDRENTVGTVAEEVALLLLEGKAARLMTTPEEILEHYNKAYAPLETAVELTSVGWSQFMVEKLQGKKHVYKKYYK
jgi:hypothetical protein